jgi:arylsulfatase A-like enzyme
VVKLPATNTYCHLTDLKMKSVKALFFLLMVSPVVFAQKQPNIIIIYADDLGYGDVSAYGATKIQTPNIDALANKGLKFTQAYATSSTCTPSRFSLLTGKYAWRKSGTDIAPGDAALLIPTTTKTMPAMLQDAGYKTAAIGKWHLGLGPKGGPNWNGELKPGPLEIGFDYCFLIPATADRVPTVFMENRRILNLDPNDPIAVNYQHKVGNWPTGAEHPELLKMGLSDGHAQTITNGISRIGYMTGGTKALWRDEDLAIEFKNRAVRFIEKHKENPFFLYFATNDIHVPRSPNEMFVGKSGLGPRGDVILQLDWTVGEIVKTLDSLKLSDNTLIVFSSDNGPVLDDGYVDFANEMLNGHTPSGNMRGGKYSAYDAGTKVPFITYWPNKIEKGISNAAISQVDLYASFAALTEQKLDLEDASDSFCLMDELLGKSKKGRPHIIQHAMNGTLSYVKDGWKFIEPGVGPKILPITNIELGNADKPQLYHLKKDVSEQKDLSAKKAGKTRKMAKELAGIKSKEKSSY